MKHGIHKIVSQSGRGAPSVAACLPTYPLQLLYNTNRDQKISDPVRGFPFRPCVMAQQRINPPKEGLIHKITILYAQCIST